MPPAKLTHNFFLKITNNTKYGCTYIRDDICEMHSCLTAWHELILFATSLSCVHAFSLAKNYVIMAKVFLLFVNINLHNSGMLQTLLPSDSGRYTFSTFG